MYTYLRPASVLGNRLMGFVALRVCLFGGFEKLTDRRKCLSALSFPVIVTHGPFTMEPNLPVEHTGTIELRLEIGPLVDEFCLVFPFGYPTNMSRSR